MALVIEMKKEIGKRIREYRKLAKLSQIELAEKLSVTNRAVSNWESGANGVDVELIPAICEALHISPNDLMDTPAAAQPSPAALDFALRFEKLDRHAQQVLLAVMRVEEKRIEEAAEEAVFARGYLKGFDKEVPIVGEIIADGSVETRYAAQQEVKVIIPDPIPQLRENK
jgi:transcriptional regulator with XRE-family HTH domain